MTQTMHFDGTHCTLHCALHPVVVHCALSLQRRSDLILSLRAKRSNLSFINKQYLLIRG
ncbi:MAG: hypothetical protein U0586_09985 [Candidatus Brocadiaceae bacterium]